MPDDAVGHVIQAPIILLMVLSSIAFAIHMSPPQGVGEAQKAYEQKAGQAEDLLLTGQDWCCPEDPSAANILQDRAMQAWAGDPEPLRETFTGFFLHPESTDYTVKASWAPRGGHATHTVDIYRSDEPTGKTVGIQEASQPAHQGPAYLLPRLDKLSAESSADILAVPIEEVWPYRTDPYGSHDDHVETSLTYERTFAGDNTTETRAVSLTGHTEITAPARPAVELHFQEPDWQELEVDSPVVALGTGEMDRSFTQVLSKDDLASERSIHEELADGEDLDDGEYPHHPFQLQVNVTGDGAVGAGNGNTAEDGNTTTLEEAYELTIHVPRGWEDVNITPTGDDEFNEEHGWNHTTVETLPTGDHRITSLLSIPAEFHLNGTTHEDSPVWTLEEEIQAPFRFHARPPSQQASTELGFHDITATVESVRLQSWHTADLTVELATSPGRVHRSLDVQAPSVVPPTTWQDKDRDHPHGVKLVLGAVFQNGGEATDVQEIAWRLPPQPLNVSDEVIVREDYTGRNTSKWKITVDETTGERLVRWNPRAPWEDESLLEKDEDELLDDGTEEVDPTCEQLAACSVAAVLTFDGHRLEGTRQWAPPRLETLYNERDVHEYVDWFIRSDRAWEGVPKDLDSRPGFALAHRSIDHRAGPAEGSYVFGLPPSSTPACTEAEVGQRNRAHRTFGPDRVHYDFGPREDGIPHVSSAQTKDGEGACSTGVREFAAVGQNGDRWRTDAIGKTTYESVPGLSGQAVADWQSGLAESNVTANREEVRAGEEVNVTVKMDSLLDVLLQDDAVGNASVHGLVYDPYNAWENEPWMELVIRDRTGFGTIDMDSATTVEYRLERSGEDKDSVGGCKPPAGEDRVCRSVDSGEPIPPWMDVPFPIPENAVPGTHLIVIEVSWEFTLSDGNTITETGRLIEPIDVLSPEGDRVQASTLGVTAWDTDWR